MPTLNREEILKIIPHGTDALILDEICDYNLTPGSEFIIAKVTLSTDYSKIFEGHFPGFPVGPAHWQIEIGCLAATTLCALIKGQLEQPIVLTELKKFKFRNYARPDDTLLVIIDEVKIKKQRIFDCKITLNNPTNNSLICSGYVSGWLT
ncbi:MAG: hypothetical protein WCG01_02850 [bacterium]